MNMQKRLEVALNEETAAPGFEDRVMAFEKKFTKFINKIDYSDDGDINEGIEIYFKKSATIMDSDLKKMMASPLFKKAMYTIGGKANELVIILMPTSI